MKFDVGMNKIFACFIRAQVRFVDQFDKDNERIVWLN